MGPRGVPAAGQEFGRILTFLRQLCEHYGIDLQAEYERKMPGIGRGHTGTETRRFRCSISSSLALARLPPVSCWVSLPRSSSGAGDDRRPGPGRPPGPQGR